jgi:hypothetical protein
VAALFCTRALAAGLRLVLDQRFRRRALLVGSQLSFE